MNIRKLIESLERIADRHPLYDVDVVVLDERGYRLSDFDIVSEIVIPAKRITVQLIERKQESDGQEDE